MAEGLKEAYQDAFLVETGQGQLLGVYSKFVYEADLSSLRLSPRTWLLNPLLIPIKLLQKE